MGAVEKKYRKPLPRLADLRDENIRMSKQNIFDYVATGNERYLKLAGRRARKAKRIQDIIVDKLFLMNPDHPFAKHMKEQRM